MGALLMKMRWVIFSFLPWVLVEVGGRVAFLRRGGCSPPCHGTYPLWRTALYFPHEIANMLCNAVYCLLQIFKAMEMLGISLEDATKVMTVSSAFRKARTTKGDSAVEAMDELTSRLNLADLSRKGESSRSPSPSPSAANFPSTPSNLKMSELSRNESVDSFQTRPSSVAKKGQRPMRAAKSHQQGRGRKRALAEKMPESSKSNVMLEEPKNKVAAVALEVKEKMLNAKLSKAEGKKPKSSARAKSPEGMGARGKRAPAVLDVEDSQAIKRPRTRSQTEESIPAI